MRFVIDQSIFEMFPDLMVMVVGTSQIDNHGMKENLMALLRGQEDRIRKSIDLASLADHPRIKVWREAYRAFGAKPKDHLSSVENLYWLILKGGSIRHINTLVDMYNLVSLQHMIPVGGEDLSKINGDIYLTTAGPHEAAALLLGDKEPRPPHPGEVIYKDDISAICRRLNWREADRTKITEETTQVVFVSEGLPSITRQEMEKAMRDLQNYITTFLRGGSFGIILDYKNPLVQIT